MDQSFQIFKRFAGLVLTWVTLSAFTFPFAFWQSTNTAVGGNDTNTVLLLHCDGANGANTFTDTSVGDGNSPHTMSVSGSETTSTTQIKFGTASCLPGGTPALTAVMDSDFQFGTGDWEADIWLYRTTTSGAQYIFSDCGGKSGGTSCNTWRMDANGNMAYYVNSGDGAGNGNGGTNIIMSGGTVSLNTWTHVAISMFGGTYTTFKNGVIQSTAADTTNLASDAPNFYLFQDSFNSPSANPDFIDEIRISKGVSRYNGAAFTPNAGPYTP